MKNRAFFWIKIVVAVILLGIILLVIDSEDIWSAFKSARFDLVLAGAVLMPLNIWLQEFKWRYLVRLAYPQVRFFETLGSLLGGFSFGIVTPGRLGEYSRSLFIKNTSALQLVGLTVIDKFYNLGCTLAFGLPALLTLPWALDLIHGYPLFAMIVVMAVADGILLYLALDPRPVRSLIYALQMLFPRKDRIAQLVGGLDHFHTPHAFMTLLLTIAHYLVFLLQYFLLISGFAKIDIISSCRAAAAILFAKSALPIAIGDLGIDQLASMKFFSEFGVLNAAALNASILLFTINVLIPALVGIPFVTRLQIGRKKHGADI